ncbi:lysozyme inhibitor LprI family protein [Methylomonas sp. EFPC3]|uniref:lysozyme inhibitor LprI family protein n=1 Tax=Methylomonas sp. EFPC3 TaxID=3021710 RepID=UPI002416BC2F|nr:lysozyme inhibitor LprI family protein [Methylomonas sp. EFPC3]WFP49777.1 lysozyme inhibitor LprI family protein [Methylomonas sp. EFPC3]
MKLIRLALFLLVTHTPDIVFAQPNISPEQVCEQVKAIEFPVQDKPDISTIQALSGCNSEDLYYGINQVADWKHARACAYAEISRGPDGPFEGPAILMMIYANGNGVNRNYDLAIKLACEIGGATAELQGRLRHLLQMKQLNADVKDLDICDHVTSGMMMNFCSIHREIIRQQERAAQLTKLTKSWTESENKAFSLLTQSANGFFNARRDKEVDGSGTAYGAMMVEEEASLKDDFLAALQSFDAGRTPSFNTQQCAKADAKLNTVYKKILARKNFSWGTVYQNSIKETQREWLKYRDAWVKFGSIKYPDVTADSWKTYWTQKRIEMLQQFLN